MRPGPTKRETEPSVQEWTAKGMGEQAQVPAAYRGRMRFRFAVVFGPTEQATLRGQCASYQVHPVGHVLELQEVLAFTGQTFQGTVLQDRVTYQPKMFVLGAPALLIPLPRPEAAADAPRET